MRRVRDVLLEISRSVASGGCCYWSCGIDVRVMLQRIAALQHAYRAEYGTYLPIDEKTNGRILQLNNAPGRFRYRVTVSEDDFMAYAEADFDRDGKAEVWVVDARELEPVLKHED